MCLSTAGEHDVNSNVGLVLFSSSALTLHVLLLVC
jgi:hypothetical protein